MGHSGPARHGVFELSSKKVVQMLNQEIYTQTICRVQYSKYYHIFSQELKQICHAINTPHMCLQWVNDILIHPSHLPFDNLALSEQS